MKLSTLVCVKWPPPVSILAWKALVESTVETILYLENE
ncbi:hypothetical protein TCELL_0111 [Thermogladius calderae 1633]|uniref:Uncharacterized protein n=1 Tax=Thermogladius calderae (strain DSM 22663 / VKM B-2946 / 1633) TaxID=1184251 RepID=I3TCP8_THEC1|nr:hypothetical protein TCELL_0111 [Thermogladius calderae 1633]